MGNVKFAVFFFFIFFVFVNAQNDSSSLRVISGDIEKGLPFVISGYDENSTWVLGLDEGELLTVSDQAAFGSLKSKMLFVRWDEDMNPKKMETLLLREHDKMWKRLEKCLIWAGKIRCFFSCYESKSQTRELFIQSIDKKNFELVDKRQSVVSYKYAMRYNARKLNFRHRISSDSSKLLIIHGIPSGKSGLPRYDIHVYDQDFQELWSKQLEIPYSWNQISTQQIEIDNSGNLFFLFKKFVKKKAFLVNDKPDYRHLILSVLEGGKRQEQKNLNYDDLYAGKAELQIDLDQKVICSGFLSSIGSYDPEGYFYLKFDAQTQEEEVNVFQKIEIDLEGYYTPKVLVDESGVAYLLQRIDPSETTFRPFGEDVFVARIGREGQLEWNGRFRSKSSFKPLLNQGQLCVLYSDHPKNFDRNTGERLKELKTFTYSDKTRLLGSVDFVAVSFDHLGLRSKQLLLNSKSEKFKWFGGRILRLSNDRFFVEGMIGETERFAQLVFLGD